MRSILIEALKKHGLDYDDLSTEIWLPEDAKFHPYYNSANVAVERLDVIAALTSKAIKAPEKNHTLIAIALVVYGDKLKDSILRNNGSLDLFTGKQKLKL